MTEPSVPGAAQPCGCSCGCHNKTHTGYRNVKCRNPATWLAEYKVWACKPCLEVCDG